jgi:PadR family transcriptional regulator, regulatory protein PadR
MTEPIDIQMKKGVLELCVLELLAQGDNYAYEIASKLADAIGMGEGTVYPLMRRLSTDGLVETYLVESSTGPSRKYYRLTRTGRVALGAQREAWRNFTKAVDGIVGGKKWAKRA